MDNFSSVIGYKSIIDELKNIADLIKNPEKYKALGATPPKGCMITGRPGLGKTLLCNCFIKEVGITTFVCRKDKENSKMVESIRETFEKAAAAAPSIVFLDDLDKFANEDKRHKNAEAYICVQSCIDDVKDKDVFVIATANNPGRFPRSMYRAGRFDKKIRVKTPSFEDRVKIVEHYLSGLSCVSDVSAERVAKLLDRRTCAELESIVNEAAIRAAFLGKDAVDNDDITQAYIRVACKAINIDEKPNDMLNVLAVHEASHCVVAEVLMPGSTNLITLKAGEGGSRTTSQVSQEDDYFHNIDHMMNRVKMILAGKAGIEVVFGKIDTGCHSDMSRAFSIVERFVAEYCISGFETYVGRVAEQSEQKKDLMSLRTAEKVAEYYEDTKKILLENLDFVAAIAERLVKDITITSDEIQEVRREVEMARA